MSFVTMQFADYWDHSAKSLATDAVINTRQGIVYCKALAKSLIIYVNLSKQKFYYKAVH